MPLHRDMPITYNVLIVEDRTDVAKLFSVMLGMSIYEGVSFTTGVVHNLQDALTGQNLDYYDAIVLDLFLPDSQGVDSLKTMVKSTDTPVLVVTGFDTPELSYSSLRSGAADFLVKSQITPALFFRSIVYAIEKSAMSKQHQITERTLDTLLRSAPIGIGMAVDRVMKWSNPKVYEMLGYKQEELMGQDARMIYPSDKEYERVGRLKYPSVYLDGQAEVETQWQHKDGTIKDILLSSSAIAPGSPSAGIVFTATDITEQRQVKKALRRERDRAKKYLDVAGIMLLVLDDHKIIRMINHYGAELLGYTPSELFGKNWFDTCICEDDQERLQEVFHDTILSGSDEINCHVNYVVTKTGEKRLISWRNASFEWEGSRLSISSGEDITDRSLLERRQELVISSLKILNEPYTGIETVKRLLKLIQAHTGIEAIAIRLQEGEDFPYFVYTGFPGDFIELENTLCVRQEDGCLKRDSTGQAVLECMCGCVIRGNAQSDAPFFTDYGSFWTNSTTDLLNSAAWGLKPGTRNLCNTEGYESVAIIPLKAGDEIIGALQLNDHSRNRYDLGMVSFLEELGASIGVAVKRAWQEDRIRYMEIAKTKDLLESSRLLNAGIAHELRTPLQALLNSLEIIGEMTKEPCPAELCDRHCTCQLIQDTKLIINEGIGRADYAINVLNSLSEYSKIATGEELHLINLFQELTAIIKTLKYTDQFKSMGKVDFTVEASDKCHVQMNKVDFQVLVSNLCRNARESIQSDNPKIEVHLEQEFDLAVIRVVDNGEGIDPALGDQIFKPYFSTKRQSEKPNQGLGLAMVSDILKMYGGEISYNSSPGRTEFIVKLPCISGEDMEDL